MTILIEQSVIDKIKHILYEECGGCDKCLPAEAWELWCENLDIVIKDIANSIELPKTINLSDKEILRVIIKRLEARCPICHEKWNSLTSPIGPFGTKTNSDADSKGSSNDSALPTILTLLEEPESKTKRKKASKKFFVESKEQSAIKTRIVTKYFNAYTQIMLKNADKIPTNPDGKIAFIDLFSGPGVYEDGTESTPVLVLKSTIANDRLKSRLVTIFNDIRRRNTEKLAMNISAIEGINDLRYSPIIENKEVCDETTAFYKRHTLIPTLLFADPWGAKGLSLDLLNAFLKDWGCDCIFFFNYNRISMWLGHSKVKQPIDALFGRERGASLRQAVKALDSAQREKVILETFTKAFLQDTYGKFIVKFRFKFTEKDRTSHYLIFATKNEQGHKIMKDIMAAESSTSAQGIASFEYNPFDHERLYLAGMGPFQDFKNELLRTLEEGERTLFKLFQKHNPGTRFILKNYKTAVLELEKEGWIEIIRKPGQKKTAVRDDAVIKISK